MHFRFRKLGGALAMRGEDAAVLAVAAVAAYLIFWNLDYAALWHDEAVNAIMARALAETGGLSGWNGRNLFFGIGADGSGINRDLTITAYPPWPAFPSALGILFFGGGEFALRFPHALAGALCLPVFWILLRDNFPSRPRLRLLAFTLFALSPIVILYMRQGRYYPDAMLFTLLSFYCYLAYFRGGKRKWLAALALLTVLNFLNHFAAGFAAAAALAVWHVIYYWRETTRTQWLEMAAAGAFAAACCAGYLFWAGVFGGDSALEYGADSYRTPPLQRRLLLLYYYFRDSVRTGWVPFWVAAWWAWHLTRRLRFSLKQKSDETNETLNAPGNSANAALSQKNKNAPDNSEHKILNQNETALRENIKDIEEEPGGETARRWAVFGVLIVAISALISVQPVYRHHIADMRYLIPALPFALFITAVCADWAWQKHKAAGGIVTAVLLFTNFAAQPFVPGLKTEFYGCPEENFPLASLAREINRPYPSAAAETTDYLRRHAAQDDKVFVQPWADYAVLLYYLNDKMIFCCGLDEDASLPREKIRALGAPVYYRDARPDWIVLMGGITDDSAGPYSKVFNGKAYGYPTHRPDFELHCFTPVVPANGPSIFRLNPDAAP
ncbi:MAG: ArnT family glycosyltransferase [Gammaproteobacteria bacterium]